MGCPPTPLLYLISMDKLIVIEMPYIGGVLSLNSCWIRGKGGVRTNSYHPIVKVWMSVLAQKAEPFKGQLKPLVFIQISAVFPDERYPDLDNLYKVVNDSLKEGLGVDDKYFRNVSGKISIDETVEPKLIFTIWDESLPKELIP